MSDRAPPSLRPRVIDPRATARLDPARLAELARLRPGRLAALKIDGVKLPVVYDNPPQPWLHLTPNQLGVDGKGSITLVDSQWVGRQSASEPWAALFDKVYDKTDSVGYSSVRPSLLIALETSALAIVELTVFAHDDDGNTRFEVDSVGKQVLPVTDAQTDVITFLMRSTASVQLASPWQYKLGKGGGWAFYDLKIAHAPA